MKSGNHCCRSRGGENYAGSHGPHAGRVPPCTETRDERECQVLHPSGRKWWGRMASWRLWWPILGFCSFLWFLIRVVPKPSRASYPCQRAAFPLAAGFVTWLTAVGVWVVARRQAAVRFAKRQPLRAWCLLLAAGTALGVVVMPFVATRLKAASIEPVSHPPLGKGIGVHPGRVVWVHDPSATDWEGPDSGRHWYEDQCTDPAAVARMMSAGIRALAGKPTEAEAWEALFRAFNQRLGRGDRGYQPGERIAIKLNMVTCWAGASTTPPFVDPVTREKTRFPDHIDVAPQMVLALLHQLIEVVGVRQEDISVGDTTALWPDCYLQRLLEVYPEVHYVENLGGENRERAEFSEVPLYWSTPEAEGTLQDYIPRMFAEASYVINFTTLKGHSSGVTLCGKNLYGALIRMPNRHYRNEGKLNYYNLHLSLPNKEWSPGMGHYRAIVDLMGHPDLGGKTLLCLVDGLYAGYYSDAKPRPWKSPPFGDGETGDWPSSLFLSQDPVAIDSVAHDFLLAEWPEVVTGGVHEPGSLEGGQEDYLHEAALADQPPSGTVYDPDGDGVGLSSLGVHEHWDSPETKRYSRNLGSDEGIELVAVRLPMTPLRIELHHEAGQVRLMWDSGVGPCVLEGSETLGSEAVWSPVPLPVVETVQQNQLLVSPSVPHQFYRLRQTAGIPPSSR
ncbi:MAG: DUF362 domain-containing protein [Verrucomicrobia bacterium]|nr:MAG: DUF362 domain-containing protein [Verrucomicrobiota bacterium]